MATKRSRKTTSVTSKGAVEVIEKPKAEEGAMAKKTAAKATRARKAKAAAVVAGEAAAPVETGYYCVIDHPANGETVSGLAYSIRIGASDTPGAYVEVQINGGPWSPARYGGGYWWFDWGYYTPGPHKLQARLIDQQGNVLKKSALVKCTVE